MDTDFQFNGIPIKEHFFPFLKAPEELLRTDHTFSIWTNYDY
ncbi:hypothetical protein LEP1GSC186_3486 [Leptospira noguchii serovar Autumnalis str. ZUN142]|uniref:Uncharacterized protein n=2 Tax=Leptospira noguchii TaxID=28182 RepID=T0FHM9_9LEPT|nr:hypothetical protein LEP1GSC186_3486 [Leptospira noguchii serovar Autumnalis str. ZUN142]EQA72843.1 hypothetical protein LEP1GSC059_3384 [Leptospira noguchii serovar Panama str. CZ214]